MNINKDNLKRELNILSDFWLYNGLLNKNTQLAAEISIAGIPSVSAALGSMYLSRILYGASVVCRTLKTDRYKVLADIAYETLIKQCKNQAGGFYWALETDGSIVHDSENVNMAQAFVLYGLAEYVWLNKEAELELIQHSKFIIQTLIDKQNSGFIDGFNIEWVLDGQSTKAFGTHLHLLEAFTKQYEYNNSIKLIPLIECLINLIVDKFFIPDNAAFLHRTTPDWKSLPNENWAGHNAEASWILCKSAKIINNEVLIKKCNGLAINIMDKIIEQAIDNDNGGVFNIIENGLPVEDAKSWWPQAEVVLGFINVYQITNNAKYLKLGEALSTYISEFFIHKSGEWYVSVNVDNTPDLSKPLVFFWKSMYHNVRYYIELLERLK